MKDVSTRTSAALVVIVASVVLPLSAAGAATAEEKCQAAKLRALGKLELCLAEVRRGEALGKSRDSAKCRGKFATALSKADERASRKGVVCRWLEHGDGTATDLNTGLQWELKTDNDSVHDKDNRYRWSDTFQDPDGTLFVGFLGTLNGGSSIPAANVTSGCFADKCDWRVPTVEELLSIAEPPYPGCTLAPCTTIPGEVGIVGPGPDSSYWTATTSGDRPENARTVDFQDGQAAIDDKSAQHFARAVRGGS